MKKRKYKRLIYADRLLIEKLYHDVSSEPKFLAREVNVNTATIYRELERGKDAKGGYSADIAQKNL